MKYRKDFVTNSSSSSYICDVCGRDESGMDMSLSDAMMYRCQNGHTFCDHHLVGNTCKSKKEMITEILENSWNIRSTYNWRTRTYTDVVTTEQMLETMDEEELYNEYYAGDSRYDVSSDNCPICTFQDATDEDIAAYFLKKNKISRNELLKAWKEEFGKYKALSFWLKS